MAKQENFYMTKYLIGGGNIEVIGFGDNFAEGEYRQKPIYKVEKILKEYNKKIDAIFIAAGAQKTVKFMIDIALVRNIKEIYMLHDIAGKCELSPFDDNGDMIPSRLRKIGFSDKRPTLPYYEVPVTDRCNLNCKGCLFGCNALSNGADIEYVQIEKDVRRIKELFYDIPWIRILGGEPLMHPRIIYILKMYRKTFPSTKIDLCTNGLLIPKMPREFFDVLKNEHISIHVSGYKPTYNILDKVDEIFKSYDLDYTILKRDSFSKYYTLEVDKDMISNYSQCIASGCRELYRGRLFAMMSRDKSYEFDRKYIEELCWQYMTNDKVQEERYTKLRNLLREKKVLLIAPGKSAAEEKEKVVSYASQDNVIVISINHAYPYCNTDFIFLSNLRRFRELDESMRGKCIVTSNIHTD